MWKNILEPGRPQKKIGCMRFACWILKVTNTHSKYEVLIVFSLQQWLYERASISLLYLQQIACLVHFVIKLYTCWSVQWRSSAGREEIKVRAVHRFWHWRLKWIRKPLIHRSINHSVSYQILMVCRNETEPFLCWRQSRYSGIRNVHKWMKQYKKNFES